MISIYQVRGEGSSISAIIVFVTSYFPSCRESTSTATSKSARSTIPNPTIVRDEEGVFINRQIVSINPNVSI